MTLPVRTRTLLLYLCVFLLASFRTPAGAEVSTPRQAAYQIQAVEWEQSSAEYLLRVVGDSTPAYTIYELFDPLRIVIDIADAAIKKSVSTLPLEVSRGPVTRVTGLFLATQQPVMTRIEIFLAQDHPYSVELIKNDIVVKFAKATSVDGQEESGAPGEEQVKNIVSSLNVKSDQTTSSPQLALTGSAIGGITVTKGTNTTQINILSGAPINKYEHFELKKTAGKPDRMYIDIPKIGLTGSGLHQTVGTALARIRASRRDNGVRIVFDSGLDRLFDYTITPNQQGMTVVINETGGATATAPTMPQVSAMAAPAAAQTGQPDPVGGQLSAPIATPPAPATAHKQASQSTEQTESSRASRTLEEFEFAGYTKQKITVDFFKIDLHNVFRMFKEISGQNIVVDEGVNGTLTLSLNDVPWDFALDIILNLKDLKKEERFNTIVILPKSKNIAWSKRPTDNITMKADGSIAKVDALTVTQKHEVPEAVNAAQKIIMQAQLKERAGDYQGALPLYEEAFSKWPDNRVLANRITTLCLVRLGQNAKAQHYAKTALKLNPKDYDAALQAAVASANMKKEAEARNYFDLAVSATPPAGEALTSYAAFAEENGNYDTALTLLDRHVESYGATLDTMVGRARLYDKKGNEPKAVNEYRDILLAGFDVPADLLRYIKGRIAISIK